MRLHLNVGMSPIRRGFAGLLLWGALLLQSVPLFAAESPAGSTEMVRVGILADYQPLQQWGDKQSPHGYDLDLFGEISRATGIRFSFHRYTDLDSLMKGLHSGDVQVVSSFAVTPERLTELRFTRPYVVQQQAMLARREVTSIPDLPDLAGRSLALSAGFASTNVALERFPRAPKKMYRNVPEAVRAVEEGQADLVFEALPVLMAYVKVSPNLRLLRTYDFPIGQLHMATLQSQAALAERLDQALAARDPAANSALYERWVKPYVLLSDSELAEPTRLLQAPLRVGFFADDPGTVPGPDGTPDGMVVDVLKATLQRAGLEVGGFVEVGLAEGLESLRAGRIDLMLGVTETAERRKQLSFVGPYASYPIAIVSRKSAPVSSIDADAGTFAMVRDYFAKDYLQYQNPKLVTMDCEKSNTCFDLLERGKVQAVVYPLQSLHQRLSLRGTSLAISGVVNGIHDEENFALGPHVLHLGPALRSALDSVLARDLPGLQRLRAERDKKPVLDWERLRPWLIGSGAALLLIGSAVAWHLQRLRREIAQKQAARDTAERYLAFMTHEVRNALQSVAGATVLLQDAETQDQPQERQQLLKLMTRAARSTMSLMDTLLDRHRLQQGHMGIELKPCDVQNLANQLVQDMQPAAAAKGLALSFQGPAVTSREYLIDEIRVQQVLRNLIINAVKFTQFGNIVLELRTSTSDRGATWDRLRFLVKDPGKGMDAHQLAQLFTPFGSQGGDRPGTGLGLPLCREIAEAIGGTVEATSVPGQGSEFVFAFEGERAQHGESVREPIDRLLVVDPSPVDAILLHRAFSEQGVKVELADSVASAREMLRREEPFDLVLSGLCFSDGSLADVARELPARKGVRPALIAMTDEETAEKHDPHPGLLGYCHKDSDAQALVLKVRRLYEAV